MKKLNTTNISLSIDFKLLDELEKERGRITRSRYLCDVLRQSLGLPVGME